MKNKKSKGAAVTGVIAAIATSSCCIPPVIAAIAGVGGASASLSWMEPLRPYLIVLAVLAIGYAWYAHLKPKKADDCGCDIDKPKFYQKRGFLVGMNLFAVLSISFPYYSHIFFNNKTKDVIIVDKNNVETVDVTIEGMTCEACQNHINQSVNSLSGVINVQSSYESGNAIVEFDKSQTSIKDIKDAVNSTGYTAVKTNKIK